MSIQSQEKKEIQIPSKVRVTSYPKVIYLWPTWVTSFIMWLYQIISGMTAEDLAGGRNTIMGWIWISIFTFNLFVVSFEFAAGKFLAILALIFIFLILVFLDIIPFSIALPPLYLSPEFLIVVVVIFSMIYLILWVSRRFNYLEITPQQISYHVGVLADERRYPAPGCHFEKKTEDVFERIIPPFCSKLIMKTEAGEVAEVLECVPRINKKLSEIKKILDYIQIKPG